MNNKEEMLVAHVFQLEQELARGKWDEEEEANKLIEFAKTFNGKVENAKVLTQTSEEVSK